MEIIFEEVSGLTPDVVEKMKTAAEMLAEDHDIFNSDLELSLSIVDAVTIKDLNARFRDIDKVTDVLSFPQYEGTDFIPAAGPALLGDVVICADKAKEQAEEFGHSQERELLYLFVHSVLHLLGYDHMDEDEKRQMRQVEESVMERLDLARE